MQVITGVELEWSDSCLAAELELTVLCSSESPGPARTGREEGGSRQSETQNTPQLT